jgi:MYXO-CTERM domain-containing protein
MRQSSLRLRSSLPVLFGAAWAATLALTGPEAHAQEQLVAFDETYVQELNGNVQGETFHHGIVPKPTEPASWTTPVNYAKGTAYLYMEVLEKPSKRNTLLTVCFDGPKEGYGCFDTKSYTDVGAYETKITMGGANWYQYGKVAWGQRRDDYHLVIKDPALNGTQGGKPATDYVPTKLRVVLTVVPPGGTYTPPAKGTSGGTPGADAGSGGPRGGGGAGGGSPADAAATGGSGGQATGGSSASGGNSASGGSNASGGASGGSSGGGASGGGSSGGGNSSSGGSTGSGSGGAKPSAGGGNSGGTSTPDDEPTPSACSLGSHRSKPAALPLLLLGALAALARRRAR